MGSGQNITGHVAAGDKIALTRESGGKLKMWRSAAGSSTWTQIGSMTTDTTYFDGGQSWQVGFGAGDSAYRIDDFGGGKIVSSGGGSPKLKLTDLHGDVVAEVPNASGAVSTPLSPVDIFGAPTTPAGANLGYGYLGAKQRNTTESTGTIEMGARLYQPQIGRFLQTDPVFGGSLNAYDYANQNPGNESDLSGNLPQIIDMHPYDFCKTYGNYVGCLSGKLPPGRDRMAEAADRCLDRIGDDAITEGIAFGVDIGRALKRGGKKEAKKAAETAAKTFLHHLGSLLTAINCVRGVVNR